VAPLLAPSSAGDDNNEDALDDIVVSSSGISGEIVASIQNANGFFSEWPVEPYRFLSATNERWFTDVAVADVNGDGLLDVIGCLARTGDNDLEAAVVAYLNDATSSFNETQILIPSTSTGGFVDSPLNGNIWCHQVEVVTNNQKNHNQNQTMILAVLSSSGSTPAVLATTTGEIITNVFDVDSAVLKAAPVLTNNNNNLLQNNGSMIITAALLTGRSLALLYSSTTTTTDKSAGTGGFEVVVEERMLPDFGTVGPRDLAIADLNQDGQLDTVVLGSDLLFLSYNNMPPGTNSSFSSSSWQDEEINLAPSPGLTNGWRTVTVADANGDGLPDILMSADFAKGVHYFPQQTTSTTNSNGCDCGSFGSLDQLQQILDTGGKYHISMDINKDGLNDILVRNGDSMVLYLGAEGPPTEAPSPLPLPLEPSPTPPSDSSTSGGSQHHDRFPLSVFLSVAICWWLYSVFCFF